MFNSNLLYKNIFIIILIFEHKMFEIHDRLIDSLNYRNYFCMRTKLSNAEYLLDRKALAMCSLSSSCQAFL